jgi:hypothetical protein
MIHNPMPLPRWLEIVAFSPAGVVAYGLTFWWTPKSSAGSRRFGYITICLWIYLAAACFILRAFGYRVW